MTDLRIYTGRADEDLLIGKWYLRMWGDGDLPRTFTQDSQTLASLFRMVVPPKTLAYAVDSEGIWFASWGEQMLNGAFIGLWVRADRRHTRPALLAVLDGLTLALKAVPVIFGATKQPKILREHVALGYTVVDKVDEWFDGEPGWIVKLTRPALMKTRERFRMEALDVTW